MTGIALLTVGAILLAAVLLAAEGWLTSIDPALGIPLLLITTITMAAIVGGLWENRH